MTGIELKKMAVALRLISHPAKLWVLSLLSECEKNIKSLQAETKLSQSALSRYLKDLMKSGLVTVRTIDKRKTYSLSNGHFTELRQVLLDIIQ